MLHIFLNKGIKDDIYYWSELNKIINLYCQLKKICPELDSINISAQQGCGSKPGIIDPDVHQASGIHAPG